MTHKQHIKKGRANDICGRQPCINGGTCLQTSLSPGYKCKCEGMLFECDMSYITATCVVPHITLMQNMT